MVIKKLIKFLKKEKRKSKAKKKKVSKKKIKKRPTKKTAKKRIISSARKPKVKKEKFVGVAVHYFSNIRVVVLKLKGSLKTNDKILIKGFTTDFKQTVNSMQIDHVSVKAAKKGQEVGIKVKGKIRRGDKAYLI